MELLLAVACFFLWRITRWVKECAMQLTVLNSTANDQERHLMDGLAHIGGQVSEVNNKLISVEDAADEYKRYYIKPLKGHY